MTNYSLCEVPEIAVKYVNGEGKQKVVRFTKVEDYHLFARCDEKTFSFMFISAGNDFWNTFRNDLLNGNVSDILVSAKNHRLNHEKDEFEKYWELKDMPFNNCSISYSSNECDGTIPVRLAFHSGLCDECD